jgi:light-regulated signal transduction histidine kinase (bacteriophytochrome)
MNLLNQGKTRWAFAVAMAVSGMLVRLALTHWVVGSNFPTYITFYPVVMFVALMAGFWPGMVTTLVSALIVDYWVITPTGTFFQYNAVSEWVGQLFFCGMGVFMSVVAGRYRKIRGNLEAQVAARTRELNDVNINLKKQAEDLSRSNNDLEQFAYVASHDLQEPLRAVAGFMGLLKTQYHEAMDATAKEYIDFAVEGAQRMQTLIHDLLAYSRVGTRGAAFAPMNLRDAFDNAVKNLKMGIEETGASVTCGDLPIVHADVSQMTQLLQNLIGNAVKFHAARPPIIAVTAEHKDGQWVISVSDNGIGIEPRYFERIFKIFQRLHGRTQYQGTGIGLAVCKRIVERHGGSLWVESKPGEGSVFYFSIPDQGEKK